MGRELPLEFGEHPLILTGRALQCVTVAELQVGTVSVICTEQAVNCAAAPGKRNRCGGLIIVTVIPGAQKPAATAVTDKITGVEGRLCYDTPHCARPPQTAGRTSQGFDALQQFGIEKIAGAMTGFEGHPRAINGLENLAATQPTYIDSLAA